MKILIGGGGTGGHIYPALALGRYALEKDQTTDLLFVGSAAGLESKIVPSAGFKLVTIPARGFQRSFKKIGLVAWDLFRGLKESAKIISEFKPDIVLGTGGYVAAPLVLAAVLKRLPVVIHEQNALPGLTNRLMAPFVKRVCLSFEETGSKMPRSSRLVYTGNPRAGEVLAISRAEGCRYFGFDPSQRTILIYGGSRGALRLNEVVTAFLKENQLPAGVNLIYVTGEIYYRAVADELGALDERIKLFSYLDQMPEALAASDLAVTRSGATTLAELTALGLPAILIPSPNVVNNHQYYNARLLSDFGAAVLIEEEDLDAVQLQREIARLLAAPDLLAEMSKRSRAMGVPDAAERVFKCLQEVAL
jgi:UDP-N-acetylglucosamine--N-acetylmuramyl-(pentapeptide) pyrophosphoryl-undecaprenol N-acetylglucosamine transferase